MRKNPWIIVRTHQAKSDFRTDWTIRSRDSGDPDRQFFLVDDPFNIRKAVVPLLYTNERSIVNGLGTAFGVDDRGILYTADHVISHLRDQAVLMSAVGPSADYEVPAEFGLQAFLGMGAVFGTHNIPDEDLPMITESKTPTRDGGDPMKELRGELDVDFADVCVLKTQPLKNELHTLPAGLDEPPKVGDRVVALGFPEISALSSPRSRLNVTLVEGLYASYGRIVNLYPDGRDRTNTTPAFEVEAHWPSGMSGGPVINENGKVIGIVSRSIEASSGFAGLGLASWLGRLPDLQNALRTFLS